MLAASVTACPDPSGKQVVLYGQTLSKQSHFQKAFSLMPETANPGGKPIPIFFIFLRRIND
jgi:hypothetical protein